MAVTQKVTLYNNKFTVPPVINAVQNDTDRQVEAYFGDFTLQVGMTGKLSFIRSDGTHYEVSATLSTANNTATAELDQALTQAGVTQAQLKITDSGNVGSTFTFMIKVQPDVAGISVPQDGWSAQEFDQRLTDAENAIDAVEEDVADLQDKEYDYAPVITDTASGSIASFPDGADSYPLKECVVNIEAAQSGSGDPSPTNVRPISGWSSAKVTRTGKNILQNDLPESTVSTTGWTILTDKNTGVMTVSGTGDGTNNPFFYLVGTLSTYPLLIKAGSYVLSQGAVLPLNCMLRITTSSTTIAQCQNVDSVAFTLANDTYVNVYLRLDKSASITTPVKIYPMIRLASDTDPTFAPYNGTTFTISLGDTRYGAVLDATRGKLRVTELYFDFSSVSWVAQTKSRWFYNGLQSTIKKPSTTAVATKAISDTFKAVSNDDIFSDESLIGLAINNNGSVVVRNGSTTTEPTGHMVYPLATPIEVDLTPTEITTLLGTNNLWSDTGDVEVEYCCSTKLFIEKKLAELA